MFAISMLGPLELQRAGEPITVPSGKCTEVLIRLALDAGTAVRAERLIEDLWGAEADTTARNTLQAKISLLRRALGSGAEVTGGRAGYCLAVDPGAVDALEVLRVAAAAQALRDAGQLAPAVTACTNALAMFRGEILRDAGDGDWLIPHRVRLAEVRLGLIETRLAVRMELGAAGEVIGELESLVVLHPLREGFWTLLIIALYRDGRQADALAAFRRVRKQLVEELGLDPGPELQALEQRILTRDSVLDTPLRAAAGHVEPAATGHVEPAAVRGNLPALTSELVGRESDLREISALAEHHRLVTIVGPAGVGKTRLAIEVAHGHRAPDGAWLVRLENARTADSLPQALGEALQVSGATEAMIIERLRGAAVLLVLDNCEHVLDPAAELTSRLLDATPGLTVLATSQVPLDLAGEVDYPLGPLPMTESIALFIKRATERRRSFVLDPDASTSIEEVCRALDGLPLAIELAAARTKALSVQEIARRLDDRFNLLSDPGGRRPARHRTLGSAIAWSYDLLFPDDQRGLWALACFAGGAPLGATESVMSALGVPAASSVEILGRLADRSLIAVDVGPHGSVRYRLLDSVRAFALARADEAGLLSVARTAHTKWFADAAKLAASEKHGRRLGEQVAIVVQERANIDSALAWTAEQDPHLGLQIANDFGWISVILGEGTVAAERLRRAMAAAGDLATNTERALALSLIGWDEAAADVDRARTEAEQSVVFADLSGDPTVIAASRLSLAFVLVQSGQPAAAIDVLDEWRAISPDPGSTSLDATWNLGVCCALGCYSGLALGDTARIRAATEEFAALASHLEDDWLDSQFEATLGHLAQAEHRFDDAVEHFGRAARAAHEIGLPATEGFHLSNLGQAQQQAGQNPAAIATLQRAIEITRAVGLMRVVSVARVRLGQLLLEAGDVGAARSTIDAADTWFRASGGGAEAALAACLLAVMDARDGSAGAAERLATVLDTARATDDLEVQVLALDALDALAALSADTGDLGAFADNSRTAGRTRRVEENCSRRPQ